ncbi:PREDICTED: serine/threonine-protein kinase atr-like [Ceratosolen solmsi marchali]|uniref:Serine/threonine-protein kinase ATR n=1 Tax=Ceratosolen solmsi marchali TaxID=326594 RepID=A0AAJ6YT42_9HYME|nr:PREDICTED: serine/threonine-protein kinase atr-like [Ceratosolen solmsi marchali]
MYEQQIWTFMNNTIIALFSTLHDEKAITTCTEESLHQLLESLLSRFNNLNILVPQMTAVPISKDVQKRYTAFTTWLFGSMFYLINMPISKASLKKIIDIQVCMVRILSRLNLELHANITSEYLNILEELICFSNLSNNNKEITLNKFQADQNIINDLTLIPFSVIVKYEHISLFQTSILKIIAESDVSVWSTDKLKSQLIEILVYSEPSVKFVALKICIEMFDYCLLNDNDMQYIFLFATEIVKSLANWYSRGFISVNFSQKYSKTLKQLMLSSDNPACIYFYFEILSALVNHNLNSDILENEICKKIDNQICKLPEFYKKCQTKKFLYYFEDHQQLNKILAYIIFQEIENNRLNITFTDINRISKLWISLKDYFFKNLRLEKYTGTLNFLRLMNLLDYQLAKNNVSLTLIDTEIANIQSQFLKSLVTNNYHQNKLIFENFVQLISLREANKIQIQNILLLPWLDTNTLSLKITKLHLANAKSLDSATKVKCLNSISIYGKGRQRLDVLNMCISSCEIELGVASILNCPMLLLDEKIKFDDIMKQILIPAYNTQKPLLFEALANVLGTIACIVSKNGLIVRDSTDFDKFIIKCKYCDNSQAEIVDKPEVVSSKFESYFSSFFELLNSNSKRVRLNISKNMIRLSNHVKCFNSNSLALKWISYVHDNDVEIRINFGKAIRFILSNRISSSLPNKLFQDDIPPDLEEFVKIIMDNFIDVLNESLSSSNQSLHQTLLFTAKNAACVQSHLTERRCLNIFILTILHVKSSPLIVALATNAYREVALYHKVSLKTMYIRYKKDFLKLMMALAVYNRIKYDYNMSTSVHRVAKCMGFQGSRQLLRKDGHYAVCFLLSEVVKNRNTVTLFHDIAELINIDEKQMFKTYFQHICCHVFLFENIENGIQIFRLVSNITKISIPILTADSFTLIISELMLHFHSQQEKVLNHLQFLSKFDDQQNINFKTKNEIAEYLNSMLHGVLVTFDANLGLNTEELTQKFALASLTQVINFMGSNYITQYKYKILATLRTALIFTRPGFRKLACDAWNAFLRNTCIRELGPILATICMSLMPLLETYPKETNAMLEYILIKNKQLVQEHISDLFFINDLKVSSNISTLIINYIKQTKPKTLEENLHLWIKRIIHQTDEVRLKALLYLQQFLAENRNAINDLILSDINVHPLIVELLDTLMAGCQDKDEAICVASGDCIGELGAIEPSLLPRRIISRADIKFISDMNQEFAYSLFCELVKDYQSQKNTQSMDCFSLAIQELLRSFQISPSGKNCKLWNELPSKIQHMIFPLLTSHYTITIANNDVEFSNPIYGSESGSTFEMWTFNWIISMLKSIKDNTVRNVLNACRPVFKRSVKMMTFCIPYIVAHVVLNGTSNDIRKLNTEILSVIAINKKSHVDKELSRHRPLRTQIDTTSNNTRISDEDRQVRCLQVIFAILDHLQRWLRERLKFRDTQYERIEKFCDGFPKLLLAQGCYQSYEYHRALIYLEQHMASSKKGLSEPTEGGLLAKIYTQLEEPDGVSGILVSQDRCPTLQQLVLAHEVNGQYQDAAICYERLLQNAILKPKYLQGIIQCYLELDQPVTAMNITKGVLKDRPELETLICDAEPFWHLAHFGKIGKDSNNIKLNLLKDLKSCIKPNVLLIKKKLVSLLTSFSRLGAYEQSYSYIMKLHILNEFEKACSIMLNDLENMPVIFEEWEKRDKLINASRGAEFVIGMRRAILDLVVQLQLNSNANKTIITKEIGKLWLKSAKIARKAGLYQQAYMYILSATDSCSSQNLCIEQAQLYWQKGSLEDALITLKRCLSTFFKPSLEYKKQPPGAFTTERKQYAKTKLLWAKYNDETLNVDANGNMTNYKEAYEVWRAWEKSSLAIARYYESVIDKMTDEERMSSSGRDMQTHIVNYYGKSLLCGCKYIHQSLPRMLTIWLNYASRVRIHSIISNNSIIKTLSQMTKIIEVYIEKVPLFMWLTAFSQLVSRICHPNNEVRNTLFTLIVKLIKAYPQHCLWMMASVFNSSYSARQKCCKEILNRDVLKTPEMIKLIQCFHKIWERLVELSNKHIPEGVQNTTVNVLSRSLPKLLADSEFGPIMMPTSKLRQLHLPIKGTCMDQHNPFTLNWVQIIGIEDQVAVMPSLQRPRRIALRGSDGKSYLFMCKPKDDLRRDFRLMEFNDIVNKYLQKDPESRRRRLYIRTYSVVPLNEECGLIEWVPNLLGYRNILMGLYKERNILISQKEIRMMTCALKDPLETKKQIFLEKLIPHHPPLLGDWFHYAFPDPYGWYEARTAYIRTAAVMSMVGYILGLGDRHGENILVDSKCGDCVHVDFNCLFNRGETLEWPEKVPFRLTHNMIEAMGPLKYEGPFRQSCRTTMKVLREQASTLISVLKPFVYDPLVSWNRNHLNDTGEKTNEKAVEHIKSIEERLKGMVGTRGKRLEALTLYLSVEGQVNHLILDAINVDNLCQMYIGWGPYL